MSGGRFQYKDSFLQDEIFHYDDQPTNVFEDWEISRLVWDVLDLIHDYDWYASGDTCEETWLKKKNAFKNRWFKRTRKEQIREVIDRVISDAREELYKTFGLKGDGDGKP